MAYVIGLAHLGGATWGVRVGPPPLEVCLSGGSAESLCKQVDTNDDNIVGVDDLLMLLAMYGDTCSAAGRYTAPHCIGLPCNTNQAGLQGLL